MLCLESNNLSLKVKFTSYQFQLNNYRIKIENDP